MRLLQRRLLLLVPDHQILLLLLRIGGAIGGGVVGGKAGGCGISKVVKGTAGLGGHQARGADGPGQKELEAKGQGQQQEELEELGGGGLLRRLAAGRQAGAAGAGRGVLVALLVGLSRIRLLFLRQAGVPRSGTSRTIIHRSSKREGAPGGRQSNGRGGRTAGSGRDAIGSCRQTRTCCCRASLGLHLGVGLQRDGFYAARAGRPLPCMQPAS